MNLHYLQTDDRVTKTGGPDVVDRSITISKTKDNEIKDEINRNKTKTTKTLQTFTSGHQDQCICEICTCGYVKRINSVNDDIIKLHLII